MIIAERRERLIQLLAEDRFLSMDTLAKKINVSPATIRRDLLELEADGYLEKVHGGAVFLGHPGINHILPLSERATQHLKEKQKIGVKAASLIQDGEVVIIDGGTTTYQLAKRLTNRRIHIITNSLPIANLFADSQSVELFLLGGILYPKRGVFLGPFAEETIKKTHATKAFLGTSGIAAEGITNTDILTMELQKDIIRNSSEVIVVADHTKWGSKGTYFIEELSGIDKIVSDSQPDDPDLENALKKAGVEIVLT